MVIRFKRYLRGFLLLTLLNILINPVCGHAMPAEPLETPADVVLLIDVSGSMRNNDKSRSAIEAAGHFIDRMDIPGSRAGIIGFSGSLKYEIPIRETGSAAAKEEIKRRIRGFEYGGYTDIGLALLKAIEMLTETDGLNKPMILLFTDGMIEISPNERNRTTEMSLADVIKASEEAKKETIPIYTVGLMDAEKYENHFLLEISKKSATRPFYTETSKELPQIFEWIYLLHVYGPRAEGVPPFTGPDGEEPEEPDTAEEPEEPVIFEPDTNGLEEIENPVSEPAEEPEIKPVDIPPEEIPPEPDFGGDTAVAEPEPEKQSNEFQLVSKNILIGIAVFSGMIAVFSIIRLFKSITPKNIEPLYYYFEMKITEADGSEKPLITMEMDNDFKGEISLEELFSGTETESAIELDEIKLKRKKTKDGYVFLLMNDSYCEISDDNHIIFRKPKIIWENNQNLTFTDGENEDFSKIELVYKRQF